MLAGGLLGPDLRLCGQGFDDDGDRGNCAEQG